MSHFLRRKDPRPPETASSVKKDYRRDIGEFHDKIGVQRNVIGQRDDSLRSLLDWAENLWNEKGDLDQKFHSLSAAYQKAEADIHKLQDVRLRLTNDCQRLAYEKEQHAEEVRRRFEAMAFQHSQELNDMTVQHSKDTHDADQRRLKAEADHLKEKAELLDQLLINETDNQAWTDDKMKHKFGALQNLVDGVTDPGLQRLQLPPKSALGTEIDPTRALARIGSRKIHVFLKSAIWTVFVEEFFSIPFGFGAFGSGEAQNDIMELYHSWRKLFDDNVNIGKPR
jgi:hypothetical protein